jgi:ubiquinol-cytochrome c reductase cytochrome b subunit
MGKTAIRLAGHQDRQADERFGYAARARDTMNKVFPGHFSFLFGEIALYSFLVLVASGIYLALFYDPAPVDVTYHGAWTNLHGVHSSKAYQSVMSISVAVRGGLFVRQIHHWAAHIFMGAIMIHMFRQFFTGAYRKPREMNWMVGITLLVLGILEGYMGYSMLDDLLSGTGVRIIVSLVESIPIIGTWLYWFAFGGEDFNQLLFQRLFTMHIFVVPGIIAALIVIHLAVLWYQKHTQFPGWGHRKAKPREGNVGGDRMLPTFALHGITLQFAVLGVICFLGGIAEIEQIYNYGPYEPSYVSNGAQPDWYASWLIGALRLMPGWKLPIGKYQIPPAFWAGLFVPILMIMLLYLWPFLEQWITKDKSMHHLLQRPRDNPMRTAVGVGAITWYFVLTIEGGEDIISYTLHLAIEGMVWAGRVGLVVLPPLAFIVTYRMCQRLQRYDRDTLSFGIDTGVATKRPDGHYIELRQPVRGRDDSGNIVPVDYQGAKVPQQVDPSVLKAKDREEES